MRVTLSSSAGEIRDFCVARKSVASQLLIMDSVVLRRVPLPATALVPTLRRAQDHSPRTSTATSASNALGALGDVFNGAFDDDRTEESCCLAAACTFTECSKTAAIS